MVLHSQWTWGREAIPQCHLLALIQKERVKPVQDHNTQSQLKQVIQKDTITDHTDSCRKIGKDQQGSTPGQSRARSGTKVNFSVPPVAMSTLTPSIHGGAQAQPQVKLGCWAGLTCRLHFPPLLLQAV